MDDMDRARGGTVVGVKRAVRGLDGTDPGDVAANAGNEFRNDLANAGDGRRPHRRDAKSRRHRRYADDKPA